MLNKEVPPITVVVINDVYEVIDGRQRYETLLHFCNDEFPLQAYALKELKDLDGLVYSKLPPNVRIIFNEYPIKLITYTLENRTILTKKDLERVKRDLFRRHNYGMTAFKLMKKMPLNMDVNFFMNHIQIIIDKYKIYK